MKTIKITESQYISYITSSSLISEDVYVSGLDNRRKVANIEYNRNSNNNLYRNDLLKTDKMDSDNDDTYEVPLKGGLVSYNITSIRGKEIMHYFKRLFGQTKIKIGQEEYQIEMNEPDKRAFMEQFNRKVNIVVKKKIDDFLKENPKTEFTQIAIYPVPSSSNFNVSMANRMCFTNICGLPTTIINSNILKKDASKLKKDEKFIQNNQEYYNQRRSNMDGLPGTHMDAIESGVNKLTSLTEVEKAINDANSYAKALITKYYNRNIQKNNPQFAQQIAEIYFNYHNAIRTIINAANYYDTAAQKYHQPQLAKVAKAIKYSKGQQIEKRTGEIYQFIKSTKQYTGFSRDKMIDVCLWEPIPFEIKKLGNDVRMALMNYFQPNGEADEIQKEVEKTKNSIIVIFDDNVSGGATLADICYQLKQIGMEYLVPITFGKMSEQWSSGIFGINKPKNGFNLQNQNESIRT